MNKKFKKRLKTIFIFIFIGLILYAAYQIFVAYMVASAYFNNLESWDIEQVPWESVTIEIAGYSEEITFLRRQGHPFLAEFERKLQITNSEDENIKILLPFNIGGQTNINVYLATGILSDQNKRQQFIHLEDQWGDYFVSKDDATYYDIEEINLNDDKYVGRIIGESGYLEFIPSSESPIEAIEKFSEE